MKTAPFKSRNARRALACAALLSTVCLTSVPAAAQSCKSAAAPVSAAARRPITLDKMGSFLFGGTVTRNAVGDTFHGDHGYAQYLAPPNARRYPLVMWHGLGQSGKTWETTPDGREGFEQIFVRRGWPVYVIDQPRRGRAGNTLALDKNPTNLPNLVSEASSWETFRIGPWTPPDAPAFFPGVQFSHDPAAIDQFFRQSAPNTGLEPFPSAEERSFLADAMAQLFRRTGPVVLLTHSHSGQYGWAAAMRSPQLVRAVVAYEPGEFSFPQDEPPPEIPTESKFLAGLMAPQLVPPEEFQKLTRIPIMVVYGDNISSKPSATFGIELWRMARERAKQFVATVNRHGGHARLVELPQIGICGNTHFPMSDLNNVQVADQLSAFLHASELDRRGRHDKGPE